MKRLEFRQIDWQRRVDSDSWEGYLFPNVESMRLYRTISASPTESRDLVKEAGIRTFRQELIALRDELNQMDMGALD